MRISGRYQKLGKMEYFIPDPLPPQNPALHQDPETMELYSQTLLYFGKLNETANRLADLKRFINAYVTKEAILSSDIEGIHTTLVNVYTKQLLKTAPDKDTKLVLNYSDALFSTIKSIEEDGLPISSRIIRKAHEILMQTNRGSKSDAGNYRKQSVSVGNLIPPPATEISSLMHSFELFINEDISLTALVKSGLAHVQFETIHPFLDGNGRIGRLLIVLMLVKSGLLAKPIIYPSYFFKKNQSQYYYWLDRVRTDGDFEGWIKFYMTVIRDSAVDAYVRTKDLESLDQDIQEQYIKKQYKGKELDTMLLALRILFLYPLINIKELATQLDISYNTAHKIISIFLNWGFLVEENGKKRGKIFRFKSYWNILEKQY